MKIFLILGLLTGTIVVLLALTFVQYYKNSNQLQETNARLQTELNQANYGDLKHDGTVSAKDLGIMAKHYGKPDPYYTK